MNSFKISTYEYENYEYVIKENLGLVYHIVNRFKVSAFDREDLVQVGMMGLFAAARSFDLNRGVKFSTYAVPFILGNIKKELRTKVCFLTDEEVDNIPDKTLTHIEIIPDLDEEELKLYQMRIVYHMSQKSIAEELKINQSTISRKLKKILLKLKK